MENMKRKELQVSAIENGTVIDHITYGSVLHVIRILNLENMTDPIYIGANLESKKFGKKGLIKVNNKFFQPHEINKIALVSPSATLIEIRDFEIIKKSKVEIPEKINGIVQCFNPKCVTNIEEVPTKFDVIDKVDVKLKCHYAKKLQLKRIWSSTKFIIFLLI
jgi:aspartate carbamoyltransferase regulatory subunit